MFSRCVVILCMSPKLGVFKIATNWVIWIASPLKSCWFWRREKLRSSIHAACWGWMRHLHQHFVCLAGHGSYIYQHLWEDFSWLPKKRRNGLGQEWLISLQSGSWVILSLVIPNPVGRVCMVWAMCYHLLIAVPCCMQINGDDDDGQLTYFLGRLKQLPHSSWFHLASYAFHCFPTFYELMTHYPLWACTWCQHGSTDTLGMCMVGSLHPAFHAC